ncbi:MAG: HD domain-containing protein [Spirochaetota bacterium]|nr:HD domain-containing protein [Spirochaetota bacterium]
MQVNLDQLKNMILQGRKLSLANDFLTSGMLLIGKEKILSLSDLERMNGKIFGLIEINVVEDKLVSPGIKKALLNEIIKKINDHHYYDGLASSKRKEIEKIIQNIFPHSDYLSFALQHIHQFSKKLFEHSIHVAIFSLIVNLAWQKRFNKGLIDGLMIEHIFFGAILHDIGYLTSDKLVCEIKRKDRDSLNTDVKNHPSRGYELLKRDQAKHQFTTKILNIVLQHEERIDQSGYPMGLMGSQIDISSQIVGLCNEFEHFLSGEMTTNSRSFVDISRNLMSKKNSFEKNCINVLIEEFNYLK